MGVSARVCENQTCKVVQIDYLQNWTPRNFSAIWYITKCHEWLMGLICVTYPTSHSWEWIASLCSDINYLKFSHSYILIAIVEWRYWEISRVHCCVLLQLWNTSNNAKAMNECYFQGIVVLLCNNVFIIYLHKPILYWSFSSSCLSGCLAEKACSHSIVQVAMATATDMACS